MSSPDDRQLHDQWSAKFPDIATVADACALTVHKVQGLTLSNIAISFDASMLARGHAYT